MLEQGNLIEHEITSWSDERTGVHLQCSRWFLKCGAYVGNTLE